MKIKSTLSALTIAALLAASVSTVSNAQSMGRDGAGNQPAFSFEDMDANKDGSVTKDEIAAHRAAKIAAIDADGDGFVSAEEMQAAHDQRAEDRANKRAARMIERLDSDKDGKVSVAEMTAMGDHGDRGDKMFDRIDTDNDGAISKAEADAAKEKMASRKGKHGGKKGGHDRGDHKRDDK